MQIADVMRRSLKWSFILSLVVGFVGATVGVIVAGLPGAVGAFWGAGISLAFLGLTTISIRIGAHYSPSVFFAIVMGGWTVKMVLFLILAFILGRADGVNGPVLFFCLITVMLGTLLIDVVSLIRSRVPYVDDSLEDSPKDR